MGITINGSLRINQNGSISINTITNREFICVSGAGSTIVNKTYEFYQFITVSGVTRPEYTPVGSIDPVFDLRVTILSTGPSAIWAIRWPDQEFEYYYGTTVPAPQYPYLETSWTTQAQGIAPTPVVSSGPC